MCATLCGILGGLSMIRTDAGRIGVEQDELQRQGEAQTSAPAPADQGAGSEAPEPAPAALTPTPTPISTPTPAPIEATASPEPVAPSPAGPAASSPARRRFLRYLLGFSVVSTIALVVTPVIGFLLPPKSGSAGGGGKVSAGTLDEIPLGQGKVVPMGSKPVIVVNNEQGVTAFSAICTHLGCIVAFDDGNGTIVCPCHDGRFNATTGAVLSGPPPGPLAPVTVTVEEGEIFLVDA